MTTETRHPWQAALPMLYHRAATDAEFRALCLKDARAAIAALGSFEMPDDLRLRFAEKVDELVIPLPPARSEGELGLDELDAVAGGAVNVGTGYTTGTVYSPYGYGYGYGQPSVWPPVDSSTPSGLPPLIQPGGAPPGY
jgi:hypothetical protein